MPYVGTVVDGILNSGTVRAGDAVLFGPDSNGNFHSTVIKTIERKRCVWFMRCLSGVVASAYADRLSKSKGRERRGWPVRVVRPEAGKARRRPQGDGAGAQDRSSAEGCPPVRGTSAHFVVSPPCTGLGDVQSSDACISHNTTLQRNYQAMLHCGVRDLIAFCGSTSPLMNALVAGCAPNGPNTVDGPSTGYSSYRRPSNGHLRVYLAA